MQLVLIPPRPILSPSWSEAHDGDQDVLDLFRHHYSARPSAQRRRRLCMGPGEKLALITDDHAAIFLWRLFVSMDRRQTDSLNCSAFRNTSPILSSQLITEADAIADAHWPHIRRHYTYVHPEKIRSTNPGACFKHAGWTSAGTTTKGLIILERITPRP